MQNSSDSTENLPSITTLLTIGSYRFNTRDNNTHSNIFFVIMFFASSWECPLIWFRLCDYALKWSVQESYIDILSCRTNYVTPISNAQQSWKPWPQKHRVSITGPGSDHTWRHNLWRNAILATIMIGCATLHAGPNSVWCVGGGVGGDITDGGVAFFIRLMMPLRRGVWHMAGTWCLCHLKDQVWCDVRVG